MITRNDRDLSLCVYLLLPSQVKNKFGLYLPNKWKNENLNVNLNKGGEGGGENIHNQSTCENSGTRENSSWAEI